MPRAASAENAGVAAAVESGPMASARVVSRVTSRIDGGGCGGSGCGREQAIAANAIVTGASAAKV
jgi:hypothetical protein